MGSSGGSRVQGETSTPCTGPSTAANCGPTVPPGGQRPKIVWIERQARKYVSKDQLDLHTSFPEEKQQVARFTSQVLRLHCLWKLSMEPPSFLEGRLDQTLRCLKTPLETLSLTNYQLTESDLAPLPQCPNISQLKGLDLSGSSLTGFSLKPLQVAARLQDLGLDLCGLTEAHLGAILPAPSLCHQLQTFRVSGNVLSAAMDGRPLYHTAQRHHLHPELYPAPLESFGAQGAPHLGTFAQVQAEPTEILRDLGLPWTIWLSTSPCPRYGARYSMI
ncbi:putative PRAME family member 26 [Ursus americanus]|uniref:putative PRAME family member 26 n=1 Tax=Ursus americanus TaxID=9643 RepID=UPI001E679A19|nr:putative PRAME family member 26 [Ursus americanus]